MIGRKNKIVFVRGGRVAIEGEDEGKEVVGGDEKDGRAWW